MSVNHPELTKVTPLGMAGALSTGILNGAFWGMAPVFGQSLNISESNIALLMSVTILGGVIPQWPIRHYLIVSIAGQF